jgi:glycosidase
MKILSGIQRLIMVSIIAGLAASAPTLRAQETSTPPPSSVQHPAWTRNLSIYEINMRQYTPGGTFKEFEAHLPQLKDLGVGILWFMPIQPIGVQNRKGSLGSYYSIKDYRAVNPEYGTMAEFKELVKKIHAMGMHVILDWVGNHTAWDNNLTVEHPDWFTKDSTGHFIPPVPDWTDVIDLNYDNPELRTYMTESLKFWVDSADVDGFRCDVSGMVPLAFWNNARQELDKIKPVFMLAEDESAPCHTRAFDMTYGWELHKLMNAIAEQKQPLADLDAYFQKNARNYPADAYRMYFTDNHDENSWNGTVFERLGKGAKAFAVLAATVPGMPLIYSGQEAGLNKRLKFFDKDTIAWKTSSFTDLHKALIQLKLRNKALWNGIQGGDMRRIPTSADSAVYCFTRSKDESQVLVMLNLSPTAHTVELDSASCKGTYTDVFSGKKVPIPAKYKLPLPAWAYRVLEK